MPEQSSHSTDQPDAFSSQRRGKRIQSVCIEYGKIILITFFAAFLLKIFVVDAFRIPSTSMENTLQIGDFLLVNKLAYGLRTPHRIPLLGQTLPTFTFTLFQKIHRGDVVVFEYPGGRDEIRPSESVNYIKRCIGLPGDTVQIRSGQVYVNRNLLTFPPQGIQTDHPVEIPGFGQKEMFPRGSTFSDVNYGPMNVPKKGDIIALDKNTVNQWNIFIEREGHTVRIQDSTIFIDGIAATSYSIEQNYYFMLGDNRDNSLDSRYWGFVPDDHIIGEAFIVYWSWDTEAPVSNLNEKFSTIRWDRIGTLIR